ncbi:MAG: cation:proton antiporter [Cyclobacteriaceae bacterium]
MEANNPYIIIIAISATIIFSYLFNIVSRKTNIPSVILLVALGMVIRVLLENSGVRISEFIFDILELLGIVGLIMIVLEAALDLELHRERWPIIWKSFVVALVSLILTAFGCGYLFHTLLEIDLYTSLIYAVPLSIMSSAIVIPSVGALITEKKEFMVYEATFSDILGIMFFYFLIGNSESTTQMVVFDIVSNIVITVVLSVVVSYALVLLFQNLNTPVKLFLLIAVLLLLYALGKVFHLSSLLIILVFGLVINNHKLFFRSRLKKYLRVSSLREILKNFYLITIESAFVVRTFFFVIFGVTIEIASLGDLSAAYTSLVIVAIIFVVRVIMLKVVMRKDITPEVWIAPRGLITILLFFSIPAEFEVALFNNSVLLYVILITSVIMTVALVAGGRKITPVDEISLHYWDQVDRQILEYNKPKNVKEEEEEESAVD